MPGFPSCTSCTRGRGREGSGLLRESILGSGLGWGGLGRMTRLLLSTVYIACK